MTEKSPLVSICCLTYNHKNYIENALDGMLNQRVDFDFEVIVHDDSSTDGTAELVEAYTKEYPEIIKPIYQPVNLLSLGVGIYQIYTKHVLPLAKARYIAICEGDDFWADQTKLQQQVKFLEKNPQHTICFHKVGILKNGQTDYEIYDEYLRSILGNRTEYTYFDLLKNNFIPNCAVVYRNVVKEFPDLFRNLMFPDWPLHLLYAKKGRIGYINSFMAIHREHDKGIWNGSSHAEKIKATIGFYMDLLHLCGRQHHPIIFDSVERYINSLNPSELGHDFEIGLRYGMFKEQQEETEKLKNTLETITQSGSYRLARKISRIRQFFTR